ncbi:MAG: hypothetical protein AAF558_00285 [Verrucomicrobiota bacterium]
MAQPFVPGDFLSYPFMAFVASVNAMDRLLGSVARYAALSEREYLRPRVSMGGSYDFISFERRTGFFDKGNQERLDRYKSVRDQRGYDKDAQQLFDNLDDEVWQKNPLYEGDPERDAEVNRNDDNSLRKKLGDAYQTSQEPNKFSEGFEKWRDGDVGFLKNEEVVGAKSWIGNKFKDSVKDALAYSDDRGGRKDIDAGISGGGFQLPALSTDTALLLFQGQQADLLRVEIPQLFAGFFYTRFFPLPAFPPLGLTLGFNFNIQVNLNFGYDNQGFFWTNRDASSESLEESNRVPTFGFSIRFSVGVELNLGLIAAGIEAFLEVGVEFFWNVGENSEKIRQREIDWLFDNGRSLFDVRVYGKVGVELYVDVTIPVPFVGPIVRRIVSKVFETFLFDEFIDLESGVIQLAQQSGDTLRLNIGTYASQRIFADIRDINEVYKIFHVGGNSSSGEDVVVAYYGQERTYYEKYTGVKHIYGYAGDGQTEIDAGDSITLTSSISFEDGGSFSGTLEALKYATVNFFAGDGSTFLRTAGASVWGTSRLDGRDSSGTLDATQATKGLALIAGTGNTIIRGGSGGDSIVSNSGADILRGNGGGDTFYFLNDFGRDRLFVTGTGNTVSFDADTLTGFAVGGDYQLPTHTEAGKFQFGQLVQSVKIGSGLSANTAFYAVDPDGSDRIQNWIGTSGDDTWNVFHFAPGTGSSPLTLTSNGGSDFYSVFLGDPLKVYNKNASDNQGKIKIDDSDGTGTLLLTQTFADSIEYDSTSVTNGRELMEMVDIETINLDAGDSTLFWGASGVTTDIIGGTITTGRIIMLGDVNLTGNDDVVLNLNRTFTVDHQLNIKNASSTSSRDVYINIENPNAELESNLLINSGGSLLLSDAGSAGDGYGNIYIYVPTGYAQNQNDISGGFISATNGIIEIRARNGVGSVNSKLDVRSSRISANTSSTDNVSGVDGIYLTSPIDLNIRATQNLDGLSTANGAIMLEVSDPSYKLTYGTIEAGGDKNITIIADDVELAGAYSTDRITTSTSLQDITYTRYELQKVWNKYTVTVSFGFLGSFSYDIWKLETENVAVTYTVEELVTTTTTQTTNFAAGTGTITGTGQITFLNYTDLYNMDIGAAAASTNANTLSLTSAILDSLTPGFSLMLFGNAQGASAADIETGLINVNNYAFSDQVRFRGSSITAGVSGQTLSSLGAIEFQAYDALDASGGTGDLTFVNGALYEALTIAAQADGDLDALGSFTSNATANGMLLFQAGYLDGGGNVTLSGSFTATGTGSTLEAITGTTSGDILIKSTASFNVDDKVTLNANQGTIDQEGTSGRITVANLEVLAAGAISIRTDVDELVNALIDGTGDLTIDELDDLIFTTGQTEDGDISITTGGNLSVGTIYAGVVNTASIIAADLHNITIDAEGTVMEINDSDTINLWADKLTVDSLGDIDFDTQVKTVDLESKPTSGTGNIIFKNFAPGGSSLTVEQVLADNGAIVITTDTSLVATDIQTNQGSGITSATNTITLNTTGTQTIGDVSTEGHADVNLNVTGLIEQASSGTSLVDANDLFIDIISTTTVVDDAVDINIAVGELVALMNGGVGNFVFNSEQDLTIRNIVNLGDSNVTVNVTDTLTDPSLSIERLDTVSGDITLTVDGAITDLDDGTVLDSGGGVLTKITGDALVATSNGDSSFDTGVNSLDIQVGGTGTLTIQESDSVNLLRGTTNSGDITIETGIASLTSGALFVDELTAGATGGDDIFITTNGAALRTLTTGSTQLIHGDLLDAKTDTGVGDSVDVLNTRINTLIASTTQAGRININEFDGIELSDLDVQVGSIFVDAAGNIVHDSVSAIDTSGGLGDVSIVDLTTTSGTITALSATSKITGQDLILSAPGDIDVRTNVGTLDAEITGDTGTVGPPALPPTERGFTIREDNGLDVVNASSTYADFNFIVGGDLNVQVIDATQSAIVGRSYDVTIDVEGEITRTDQGAGNFNVRGDLITIDSLNGIDLVTDVLTFDVESEAAGDFIFDNLTAATINKLHTFDGAIGFTNEGNLEYDSIQGGTGASFDDTLTFDVNNGSFTRRTEDTSLIIAQTLIADVSGDVDLETQLVSLDLQTDAAGTIDIDEVDGLNVDQLQSFDGAITLDADGDVLATLIKSDTSNTTNTITINLNDSTTFLSDLTVTEIDAGLSGIVDLNIEGIVNNSSASSSLLRADRLELDADGTATDVVDLRTRVNHLFVETTQAGNVLINETDSTATITLHSIDIADGDFVLTAEGNVLIDAQDKSGTVISNAVITQTAMNDVIWTVGGQVALNAGKVVTDLFQIGAVNDVTIDTTINTLDVDITGTASTDTLLVTETDHLNILNATTAAGNIDMTVGETSGGFGGITTVGNLTITNLKAGATNNADIVLTVYGTVQDASGAAVPTSQGDDVVIDANGLINLSTDFATLDAETFALGDITIAETDDINLLDIELFNGSLDVDAGGSIVATLIQTLQANQIVDLLAGNSIAVDTITTDGVSGQTNLTAQSGAITRFGTLGTVVGRIVTDELVAQAATGIAMFTNTNFLTTTITGAAGNIEVDELDSLTIRTALTPTGTFDLEVGDRIEVDPLVTLPTPHVTADTMILTSVNGIASAAGFLNSLSSVIDAYATTMGGIFINNLKDVELREVIANNGEIQVTNEGNMLVTDVRTNVDDDANDITLITNVGSGGDITINYIGAGHNGGTPGNIAPLFADVTVDADGAIEGLDPTVIQFASHVLAETITYIAETGIGNNFTPIVTGRVLSATTTTGSMNLGAATSNDFQFINSSTGNGSISFVQAGTGNLIATNISSNNGNVSLSSIKGGNIDAENIQATNGNVNITNRGGGSQTVNQINTFNGDINLTVGEGGWLNVYNTNSRGGDSNFRTDELQFLGGPSSINGGGRFTINSFSPGVSTWINSPFTSTSLGGLSNILEISNRDLRAIGFNFFNVFIGNRGNGSVFQTFENRGEGFSDDFFETKEKRGAGRSFRMPGSEGLRLVDLLFPGMGDSSESGPDEEDPFFKVVQFQLSRLFNGDSMDGLGVETGETPETNAQNSQAPEQIATVEFPGNADQESSVGAWSFTSVLLFPLFKTANVISKAKRQLTKSEK